MINLRTLLLTAAGFALLPGATMRASNISVAFDAPTIFAEPGQTITFSGSITNLEPSFVDLNGCGVSIAGQFSTDNCSLFFTNAPLFLSPGETNGPFDMFTITLNLPYTGPANVPISGTFTVLGFVEPPGGDPMDGSTLNVLGEQTFDVVATPEPGSALLLTLGLALFLRSRRRPTTP